MKTIFVIAIMLLCFVRVNAQTGMPQTLSCTETAFNFSFNLGKKGKVVLPKMGPVDIRKLDAQDQAWVLKMKCVKPDTTKLTLLNPKNYNQKILTTNKLWY